jgi:hypothetical protein
MKTIVSRLLLYAGLLLGVGYAGLPISQTLFADENPNCCNFGIECDYPNGVCCAPCPRQLPCEQAAPNYCLAPAHDPQGNPICPSCYPGGEG